MPNSHAFSSGLQIFPSGLLSPKYLFSISMLLNSILRLVSCHPRVFEMRMSLHFEGTIRGLNPSPLPQNIGSSPEMVVNVALSFVSTPSSLDQLLLL